MPFGRFGSINYLFRSSLFLAKLVPVGYGINKLQIICVVEDEKVSIDALTEEIQNFEDVVQSVDVAAFNKI
jgi:elongation factor 1-beta